MVVPTDNHTLLFLQNLVILKNFLLSRAIGPPLKSNSGKPCSSRWRNKAAKACLIFHLSRRWSCIHLFSCSCTSHNIYLIKTTGDTNIWSLHLNFIPVLQALTCTCLLTCTKLSSFFLFLQNSEFRRNY